MSATELSLVAFMALCLCGCGAMKRDYQAYDRSHSRRIDLSYDASSETIDIGYTITPIGPLPSVKGLAK